MLCFYPPPDSLADMRAWVRENGEGTLRVSFAAGGTTPAAGNSIAGNDLLGVEVRDSITLRNRVLRNSIHSNCRSRRSAPASHP